MSQLIELEVPSFDPYSSNKSSPEMARPIPMDQIAEAVLLSAMVRDPQCIGNVVTIIRDPGVFTDDRHGSLYEIFVYLFNAGKEVTGEILMGEIRKRKLSERIPAEFITAILGASCTAVGAEYHAMQLVELLSRRKLISALDASLKDCYSPMAIKEVTDNAESRIFSVMDETQLKTDTRLSVALEEMINSGIKQGLMTGYTELDEILTGLHGGEMLVLAARPSVGKSALALNIAEGVGVGRGNPVGIFTLEMRTEEVAKRIVCSRAGVNMQKLRRGNINAEESSRMGVAMGDLQNSPIFIDDSPSLTIMDLRAKARRMKLKHGIQLFIIDYLQLMDVSGRSENRQQDIARISRGVKTLANELDVPILALSQLNRSSEIDQRRPRPSDMRESGTIEQDADVVMLLHREDFSHREDPHWLDQYDDKQRANFRWKNIAELNVAKQRNGPTGVIWLTVRPEVVRFENGYSPDAAGVM